MQAAEARLLTIDKMVESFMPTTLKAVLMMIDFAEWFRIGKRVCYLKSTIAQLNHLTKPDAIKKDYERFFDMAKQYTHIEELTRDTLLTFVDRIEIGPKILPDGTSKVHSSKSALPAECSHLLPLIGEVKREATRDLPIEQLEPLPAHRWVSPS